MLDGFHFSNALHNSILLHKSRRRHARNRRSAGELITLGEDHQVLFQREQQASALQTIKSEPLWGGQAAWLNEPQPSFFEYEPSDDTVQFQLPLSVSQVPSLEVLPSDPMLDSLAKKARKVQCLCALKVW